MTEWILIIWILGAGGITSIEPFNTLKSCEYVLEQWMENNYYARGTCLERY